MCLNCGARRNQFLSLINFIFQLCFMFSALVVLNLFDTDLILETIHLSVRWRFFNGLRTERIPHQQGGISSRPAPAAPRCSGSESSAGRARGSILLWMISPVFPSYLQGVFAVSWWPVKWCRCGTWGCGTRSGGTALWKRCGHLCFTRSP